jgi:hypothetical protein
MVSKPEQIGHGNRIAPFQQSRRKGGADISRSPGKKYVHDVILFVMVSENMFSVQENAHR